MLSIKNKTMHAKLLATFAVAILLVILLIFLWPKSFAYSDCGRCEMLGYTTNIERLEGMETSAFGIRITAIVNTKCNQGVTAEQEFLDGRIILKVRASGEPISNHCICDRELVFNLPKYAGAKIVELYYKDRLVDKRSIINNTLSDGLEFCESDAAYKPICYYRAAFMKGNPEFCKKTANPKRCEKELEEFLTLKCITQGEQYCRSFFERGR